MNKEIKFLRNILYTNFRRLSSPYKVTLALTYRCNLRCKICSIWQQPRQEELDTRAIDAIFRSLPNLSWLDITGGEVTLRDDIVEVVQTIIKNTKNLFIIHISTNGQLPQKTFMLVRNILKYKVRLVVTISVDGHSEMNTELRGVRDSYIKSIETFKLLKGIKKVYCYISCTISKYNVEYLADLLSNFQKDVPWFSSQDLHFNIFHNSPHYYRNDASGEMDGLGYGGIVKYIRGLRKGNFIKSFLERLYISRLGDYLEGNKFPLRCQALKSTCFIDPYGSLYPCAMYNQQIGRLQDFDFNLKEIWKSNSAFRALESISGRNCPGCWSPCEAYPAILGDVKGVINHYLQKITNLGCIHNIGNAEI